MRVRQRRDLGHRLDDSGLVIGEHDRDQRRPIVAGQHVRQRVEADEAVAIDRDPVGFGMGAQDRIVLYRRYQDPFPTGATKRQVVGLGAAAAKHNTFRRRPDHRCDGGAAVLNHPPRGAAPAMDRGRVAA